MTSAAEIAAGGAVRAAIDPFAPVWIETPILQPTGLYLELLGEEIRARAFTLVGADGAELCLRPDMTAPVVRDVLAARPDAAIAAAYDGLVFRRQTRASQRETEFRVIGLEHLSPSPLSPETEGDLIAAAIEAVRALGVEPRLKLGDMALARALIAGAGLAPAWEARLHRAFARTGDATAVLGEAEAGRGEAGAVGEALAALTPERAVGVVEAMLARSGAAMVGGRTAQDVARRLTEKAALARADRPSSEQVAAIREALAVEAAPDDAFAALARTMPGAGAALAAASARWRTLAARAGEVEAVFSAGFGRGPAYYDGFVFELEAPALGERASLGGGGRYDDLLHRLGGGIYGGWSAMGFSLRPKRLADAAGART
jgi:ATP phosphoribosyltransferase regulatory subunit